MIKKLFHSGDNLIIQFNICQASAILKHPYLQPYVEQYRSSFNPPASHSPEKPLFRARDTRKNLAESESSNSSCSDKGSLVSSEKKIMVMTFNCDNKGTETDLASIDDEVGCEQSLLGDEQSGALKMDAEEVMKHFHSEHISNSVSKRPKSAKNTVVASKAGNARETSSPMRGNRTDAGEAVTPRITIEVLPKVPKPSPVTPGFKANVGTSPPAPANGSFEPVKRSKGTHSSKHQVSTVNCFLFPLYIFSTFHLFTLVTNMCSYLLLTSL